MTTMQDQETKTLKQQHAYKAWIARNYTGLIAGCTGFGKSRLGTWAAKQIARVPSAEEAETWGTKWGKVLLVVPTIPLRDKDWPDEFERWEVGDVFKENVTAICYDSLPKYDCRDFHLVIFDEFHNMVRREYQACNALEAKQQGTRILMLSATEPKGARELSKVEMMNSLGGVVFRMPLDQGVDLGIVSDYRVTVVEVPLDDTDKYIEAGRKGAKFFITEKQQYDYLQKTLVRKRAELSSGHPYESTESYTPVQLERLAKELELLEIKFNRFIYTLRSKEKVGAAIFQTLRGRMPVPRVLVFGGSIDQVERICGQQVYHSKLKTKKKEGIFKDEYLNRFRNMEIDYLGTVDALNEGANVGRVDYEIFFQVDSNPRKFVQRLGRGVRFLPGHVLQAIVLVAQGTADESWFNNASKGLDEKKITRIDWSKPPKK